MSDSMMIYLFVQLIAFIVGIVQGGEWKEYGIKLNRITLLQCVALLIFHGFIVGAITTYCVVNLWNKLDKIVIWRRNDGKW